MSGIAAAGLALSGATVRVLDATGKVAATGRPVAAATGTYGPIAISGGGPYRVEACGTVADKPICLWGATTSGGKLNLTPMTSALTVLASGQSPETLMNGAVQGLTDEALAAAQVQLRAALAPALADAGLSSDFDLLTGALTPGSHAGYDRVLDTVDVTLGADSAAFVQLGSRLGSGRAYLEPGTTQGSFTVNPAAAGLDLTGIDTLYATMITATANSNTCQPGLIPVFDPAARASIDTLTFTGAAEAAQLLCLRLNGTLGDGELLFGGKLLPTTLGRCDFGTGDPLCRVSLVFQNKQGLLRTLGVDQAVVKRASGWKFLGNRLEVQASASARLVLTRRGDAVAPDTYARYLDITIPAADALQCARVSQKDGSGADVALALFKKAGSGSALSLWSVSSNDATPSLDPATGATRGPSIVSLPLPSGTVGDTVARNFARYGRALKVELFSDSTCATPMAGADAGVLNIELAGTPPLAISSMSGQPWPLIAAPSLAALTSLKAATNTKVNYGPIWTFPRGGIAMRLAQLCQDASCNLKAAELELASNAQAAALTATVGTLAIDAGDFKQLRLKARTTDGLLLQMDVQACATQTAGRSCN